MSKDKEDRQETIEELFAQLRTSLSASLSTISVIDDEENVRTMLDTSSVVQTKLRPSSTTKLIIKHVLGSKTGQTEEFSLNDFREITFGREPSSTVPYDPYIETLVARQQAKIVVDNNLVDFYIIDNNSRNGTYINNQRVIEPVKIKPGDVIKFGHQGPEFVFDLNPRPIPPTEVDRDIYKIPPTQVERSFSPARVEAGLFGATLTENLIIKHIKGSKIGQINTFPTKDFREITIGREPMSIIKFDSDRDDLVSNKHAKIYLEPGPTTKFILVDLNSRNGTYLNNQRVIDRMPIKTGDKIRLGSTGPEFEVNIC
jgi:pSer/pThr/pTyr-binding forkhead associated (FHA) protein